MRCIASPPPSPTPNWIKYKILKWNCVATQNHCDGLMFNVNILKINMYLLCNILRVLILCVVLV